MLKWIRALSISFLFISVLGTIQLISNFSLSSKDEALHVSVYNDFLDLEMIESFTKETGIKVHLHFYNANEELLTKIQFSKGEGLDILIPSDYACKILADKGFLQPIDKSRLNFLDRIYPFLLDRTFDPKNIYSIPYSWEAYGIVYDPQWIKQKEFFISDYFNPSYTKVMTPDFIEATTIAAYHLFQDKGSLTDQEVQKVSNLLREQNQTVTAYADFRSKDILSSKSAEIAVIKTSFLDAIKAINPGLEFSLTKDKFFASIENVVILKNSKKIDHIYTFLNYIYKPENLALTVNLFPCYPSCADTFNEPNDHEQIYFDVIKEIESRPDDMRLFYYVTEPDKGRNIFIESKT